MIKKFDLFAISALAASAVLSVWLGLWGPNNATTLKDWQPLMAAFVALGAAALAYKAAMAKVAFDSRVAKETDERRIIGLYLRLGFAARVLQHEASVLNRRIEKPESQAQTIVSSDRLDLGKFPPSMTEAWEEIALFPRNIAIDLSAIQVAFYNFELIKGAPAERLSIPSIGPDRKVFVLSRENLGSVIEHCNSIRTTLRKSLKARGVEFR